MTGRLGKRFWNGPLGVIDETDAAFSQQERRIAELLIAEGWNVKAQPMQSLGRNPDATVMDLATNEQLIVEFKSLRSGADNSTVKNDVSKSLRSGGQARHVVIDARLSGLTSVEAERAMRRISNITLGRLESLRIIGDDFDVTTQYPYQS